MWAADPPPPPSRRPSISFILAVLFASTTCYLLFVSTHAPDASHPNGIQEQQENFQSAPSVFPRSSDTDVTSPRPHHDERHGDADSESIQPKPHYDDDDKDGNSDKKHKSTHNEGHDKTKDKDKEDKKKVDKDKNKRNKPGDHDQGHDDDDHDKKDKKKNKKTPDHDDHDQQEDKEKADNKDKTKKNKDGNKDKNKKDDHDDNHDDDKNHKKRAGKYRVLLFGDSITHGSGPNPSHPYSIRLQEKFDKHGIAVELINQGRDGNLVVQDRWQIAMIDRLPGFLPITPQNTKSHDTAPLKEAPAKFDMVIILGGTNDITNNVTASDTLAGLISMHERVRANGAVTVALTVPERYGEMLVQPPYADKNGQAIGNSSAQQMYSHRMIINQGLETYCTKHQPMKNGRTAAGEMPCVLVDFAHEIPYKQQKYWIDNLHPSPAGYDRLGEFIWDVIQPYVNL